MHKKLTFLFVLLLASSTAFAQGNTTFSWDGQVRGTWQYWGNQDLDTSLAAEDFLNYKWLRTRLGVKAEVMENTSVYVQLQDNRTAGEEGGVYDASAEGLDIHQAYIMLDKLWDSPFSLKLGRQELTYGDGRLVGADNWANTGTAFDAAKLMFSQGRVSLDLFTGQLVPFWGRSDALVPGPGAALSNNTFSGLYSSVNYLEHGMWDAYVLLYYDGSVGDDPDEIAALPDDNTMLWTLGTRTSGMLIDDNFSYHGEFAYQLGQWLSSDVSAWAFSLGAGYTVPVDVAPYFGAEFNYASGDDDETDGDRGTYTNLFPSNHNKYGYMDQFALQNLLNLKATVGFKPVEKLDIHGDFHFFWLAEENDAWYTSQGFPFYSPPDRPNFPKKFGRGAGLTENNAGNELDILLKYQYNDAVSWSLGFSHFFAGAVADSALRVPGLPPGTNSGDANWFYSQVKVGF